MDDNNRKLELIRQALIGYHYALDLEQDINVAARHAVDTIQEILGQPWIPGAILERRRRRFTWEPGDLVIMERRNKPKG
jgi:hypothetical protein